MSAGFLRDGAVSSASSQFNNNRDTHNFPLAPFSTIPQRSVQQAKRVRASLGDKGADTAGDCNCAAYRSALGLLHAPTATMASAVLHQRLRGMPNSVSARARSCR